MTQPIRQHLLLPLQPILKGHLEKQMIALQGLLHLQQLLTHIQLLQRLILTLEHLLQLPVLLKHQIRTLVLHLEPILTLVRLQTRTLELPQLLVKIQICHTQCKLLTCLCLVIRHNPHMLPECLHHIIHTHRFRLQDTLLTHSIRLELLNNNILVIQLIRNNRGNPLTSLILVNLDNNHNGDNKDLNIQNYL